MFDRGENLGGRYSECSCWKIEKVGCIRNMSMKTEYKRSLDNPKRCRICISCGRWFSNIIRKRLRIPRTHSETGIHYKERESQRKIHGDREEFQPEETKDSAEARKDSCSTQGDFIYRHHIEPRVEFMTNWNVDGNRNLSDSWTGFTRFTLLNETPPKGFQWSGERLTKIQTTSRPDHIWPDTWTRIGKNFKTSFKMHEENWKH